MTLQNKLTEQLVRAYISRPTSSLIIEGINNEATEATRSYVVATLLGSKNIAHQQMIEPDEKTNSIGVQAIRDVKSALKTKQSVSKSGVSKVITIKSADKMTQEAQNALLKILEEPIAQVCIILTSSSRSSLLTTLLSRCQIIRILPITKEAAFSYAQSLKIDQAKTNTAYLLSRGDPTLFKALLRDDTSASYAQSIAAAKAFLAEDPFNRLAKYDLYAKSSAKLHELLTSIELIAEAAMHNSPQSVPRWAATAMDVRALLKLLQSNAQTKLLYMRLCQNI